MPRLYDKHTIGITIIADGFEGYLCDVNGSIANGWARAEKMAREAHKKIKGWVFWVTLRRGTIEIQAHGRDMTYADVLARADRILRAAEEAYEREHRIRKVA